MVRRWSDDVTPSSSPGLRACAQRLRRRQGARAYPHLYFQLQPLYDPPVLSLFLKIEGLLPRMAVFLSFLLNLQIELLEDQPCLSFNVQGAIPKGIFDPVEGLKITADTVLKPKKILILISIVFGDAGKVEGEVFLSESLFPSVQGFTNLVFFRKRAG